MFETIILNKIKSSLIKSLKKFSNDNNIDIKKTYLLISFSDLPNIKILNGNEIIKELTYDELFTSYDKLQYNSLGININEKVPEFLDKLFVENKKLRYLLQVSKSGLKLFLIENNLTVEQSFNIFLN